MCDMAEEEFAEYLLWLEAAQARARSRAERVPANELRPRIPAVVPEPVGAEG